MKYSLLAALFITLACLLGPVNPATAQPAFRYLQLAQSDQSAGMSLDQAVQSVKEKTGGRILSAKTVNRNGQRIHKIKVLLPSGKVQVFRITAN